VRATAINRLPSPPLSPWPARRYVASLIRSQRV
jgi:hypothetical protein